MICFYYLSFSLLSAVLVNSALIPNNRVIVNNDSDDYTLVEGVSYNIVHLRTHRSLNDDGNYDIYARQSPSYWTIRKVYGSLYNIVHMISGRNLDSNTDRVYTSTPEDNNPYQQWEITKVENNTFNVEHLMSQYRNLDSNGNSVYIGASNDENNPFQRWSFEPANYKLNALVTEFTYPSDLKDKLDQYKKRTKLLLSNITIKNPTNATITTTIERIEKKVNNYAMEIKKSEFLGDRVSEAVSASFRLSGTIFKLLGLNTDFTRGVERQFGSNYEKVYRESIVEEVTYGIKEQVVVPPFNAIEFGATIDKVSIDIPFKAKIRITGKADRLDESGNVVPMTDVDIGALKCYLQKENYNIISVMEEDNSLLVNTIGTLKVDGYGLASTIETKPISGYIPSTSEDGLMITFRVIYIASVLFAIVYLVGRYLHNRRLGKIKLPM